MSSLVNCHVESGKMSNLSEPILIEPGTRVEDTFINGIFSYLSVEKNTHFNYFDKLGKRKDHGFLDQVEHVFFDAEGTLYIEKEGKSRKDFWANPTKERALEFFELEEGVGELLSKLKDRGLHVYVLSVHIEEILIHMLDMFGVLSEFEGVFVTTGKKDRVMAELLRSNETDPSTVLMVGDLPTHDIYPMRKLGVKGILIDREYNRHAWGPRIGKMLSLLKYWEINHNHQWICGLEN